MNINTNTSFKDEDLRLWKQYKQSKSPADRATLLKRLDPVIQSQVNKWAGPVPREVLLNEAKLLAIKGIDSYDENKGTALTTHVINAIQPISRLVYSHQNAARLPENLTLKLNSYLQAKDHLTTVNGYSPTLDEMHQELGWHKGELRRIDQYQRKDLVESVGGLNDDFFGNDTDEGEDVLSVIYFDLTPTEKKLFEYTTGYGGKPKLSNPTIMGELNWTQAQLSYQKTLLTNKIKSMLSRIKL
jgi:DNA-directed RNA polymerase specialized sigma subunit